jgi:ribonuclease Z
MRSSLRILGTGASGSSVRHIPSSQVFNIGRKFYMVDCGETASLWFSRFNLNIRHLKKVFITHMHADHCLGLPGVIYAMDLLGAEHLDVYGPKGLKQAILPLLSLGDRKLRLDLSITEVNTEVSEVISQDDRLKVTTIPLRHSVPCVGFKFEQIDPGLIVPDEIILQHDLNDKQIEQLEKGYKVKRLDPESVCNRKELFSYAYLADTCFFPDIVPLVTHCNLMFHETSFLNMHKQRAKRTLHSTTTQAGEIAALAKTGALLIGHYSMRYNFKRMTQSFVRETRKVFPYTVAANEGMSLDLTKGYDYRYTFKTQLHDLLCG